MSARILLALLLTSVISGCVYGTAVGFGEARERGRTASTALPPLDATRKALEVFCQRAPEVFDVTTQACRGALSNVNILFVDQDITFPGARPIGPNTTVTGYTWGKNQVVIKEDAVRKDNAHNALVHELVHVLLWNLYNDPAQGHEADPSKRWTLRTTLWVDDVMKTLDSIQ